MTYQLLLVDDEVHAIEGVKSDLDLNKLGIESLFTAYNIRQAKEIFEKESIDIMLCDIEMPKGNGLELLAWVKENHPHTEAIFLTSHADFKYAKEALQLGSLDYLLKPVRVTDLEAAINKAMNVIQKNSEITRNSQSHQLWMKHHSLIIEHFWLNLINHSTINRPSAVREQIERHHIPYSEHSDFLPILISVQRWNKTLKRNDEKILEYALKNTAGEMILGSESNGICIHLDQDKLLVIIAADEQGTEEQERIHEACRLYIEMCNRYFYCDLSCYLGEPVKPHEMASMVTELRARDRNNVALVNSVQVFDEHISSISTFNLPDWSILSSLLKTGTKESVISAVKKSLYDLVENQRLDAKMLHQFNQDFMQLIYSFLIYKGIQARQLFGDEESKRISETAGRSVSDMIIWVEHAVNKALNQADTVQETDTVVDAVKRYIAQNIDQDLSREAVAEQVYLHPDHLTRIFKKEMGCSVADYVILERIKLAKELLSQTNIPISAIALSIGYSNFSYFTKLFKRYVEMGPTEYRSQFSNKD